MKVDLSGVDAGFEPIPAGRYHVAISGAEVREAGENAKNPGSEFVSWELTVQSGDYESRKVWATTSLLPQALFGLKGLMKASGEFTDKELDAKSIDTDLIIEKLQGAEIVAVVTMGTYQGDPTNNVKRFRNVSDVDAAAADASLLP